MLAMPLAKFEIQDDNTHALESSKRVAVLINQVSMEIFRHYKEDLLAGGDDWIIPAVWGASLDGGLTPVQMEIHDFLESGLADVFALMDIKADTRDQKFSLEYVIRDLVATKVTCMLEIFKYKRLCLAQGIKAEDGYRKSSSPRVPNPSKNMYH